MKYDLEQKMTIGAKRTLDAFYNSMLKSLGEYNFEEITVKYICDVSGYPRATFYNYFDDKYDLMTYCWKRIGSKLIIDNHDDYVSYELVLASFEKMYTLFNENRVLMDRILKHNPLDSALIQEFADYLNQAIRRDLMNCMKSVNGPIPVMLLANHYSNTLMMMLEWIFISKHEVSMSDAHQYLETLLSGVGNY